MQVPVDRAAQTRVKVNVMQRAEFFLITTHVECDMSRCTGKGAGIFRNAHRHIQDTSDFFSDAENAQRAVSTDIVNWLAALQQNAHHHAHRICRVAVAAEGLATIHECDATVTNRVLDE